MGIHRKIDRITWKTRPEDIWMKKLRSSLAVFEEFQKDRREGNDYSLINWHSNYFDRVVELNNLDSNELDNPSDVLDQIHVILFLECFNLLRLLWNTNFAFDSEILCWSSAILQETERLKVLRFGKDY